MSSSGDPWAWLGLLKWSLSYTDGTEPSDPTTMLPMSPEDKAFLEEVMKDGIIDENKRMTEILQQLAETLQTWRSEAYTQESEDAAQEMLQELRDIVEQIDYARAFMSMKGLDFLLGCVQERERIPRSTRILCLGIIATMCQHNPPVQKGLLELGSLKILSDLFFVENDGVSSGSEEGGRSTDDDAGGRGGDKQQASTQIQGDEDGQLRAKIFQAISANVRSHDMAESIFCQLPQAPQLMESGLGISSSHDGFPITLQKRALFFLLALLTSDSCTRERLQRFATCISWVADTMLSEDKDAASELRETSLNLLQQILEQKKSVNTVLSRKNTIVAQGIRRVAFIRDMQPGDDRDFASVELELWNKIITLLARTVADEVEIAEAAPALLLAAPTDQEGPLPQ